MVWYIVVLVDYYQTAKTFYLVHEWGQAHTNKLSHNYQYNYWGQVSTVDAFDGFFLGFTLYSKVLIGNWLFLKGRSIY